SARPRTRRPHPRRARARPAGSPAVAGWAPARGSAPGGPCAAWAAGPLARLAGACVAAAPRAVLAQRDAIGVVALALVGLVVAPLALLAGEGDSDAHVSAGHVALPGVKMWETVTL